MPMPFYRAYGLTIDAEFPIPGLHALSNPEEPEIQVHQAALPDISAPQSPNSRAVRRDEGLYFAWPEVGCYRVDGPDRIVCDPNLEVDHRHAIQPILGVLLGVVLHLRGLYTLHASAAVIGEDRTGEHRSGGSAVAFMGWKGQGKSTTAAAFDRAGVRLLTDDVLAIGGLPGSLPCARHSFPRLKLRPEVAREFGYEWEHLSKLGDPMPKRAWTNERTFCHESRPLTCIFRLVEGTSISVERLDRRDAVQALLEHSYAPRFLGDTGLVDGKHLRQCADLTCQVPVYDLKRPSCLDVLPELVDTVRQTVDVPPAS